MPQADILLFLLAAVALVLIVLQLAILLRGRGDAGLNVKLDALQGEHRHLREALVQEQRAGRAELAQSMDQFRGQLQEQLGASSQQQRERIDAFAKRLDGLTERTDNGLQALAQRLAEDARKSREELTLALNHFGEQQQQRLAALTADNEKRMGDVRATLETRLGQSFKLVSERLEAVQRGLGEMQNLAVGVGDLKRILGNVKKRGIFGEVQLGALLEDMLAAEQYASNVVTVPGSNDRVEFAIRMPGQEEGEHVYLPIDAKFPVEDYQRLLDAQEIADADAAALAGRALEARVREEAKRIRAKYISPPHTTDFAVLFLPTEGLYAEVIRRPGLFESLQRDHRVTIAGPTTLSALLNSLQMGFRTLAIAKRSSEVWKILGVVKTEFGKFGDVLDKVKKKLDEAGRHIDATGVRTRAIERQLRGVESQPDAQAQPLLGEVLSDIEPVLPDESALD